MAFLAVIKLKLFPNHGEIKFKLFPVIKVITLNLFSAIVLIVSKLKLFQVLG